MKTNIGRLVKINLLQRFGFNEARYSKDPAKKRRLYAVMACIGVSGVILLLYVAGIAWVFGTVGAAEVIPAYMMLITSIAIFFLTVFKAGSIIFQMQTYEMLISLPLSVREIVVSRFLTMYLEDLLFSAVMMLPGSVIYAVFEKTGALFWGMTVIGIFIIPLFPLVAASIIGVFATAAGARAKHKNLITLVLSMLFVVAVIAAAYLPLLLGGEESRNISLNTVGDMGAVLVREISGAYFMAELYTAGVIGHNFAAFLGFLFLSVGIFGLFVWICGKKFTDICSALTAKSAGKIYRIGAMQQASVRRALFRREMKGYVSSNVYVMNTAVGYVLAVLFAGVVAVFGVEKAEAIIPTPGMIGKILPFLLAWTVSLMPSTVSSISMEGKKWWIPMSLPVTARDVVQSKMGVSLAFGIPACVAAAVLTGVRFWREPETIAMLFAVPLLYNIFGTVLGIVLNEHFPMMKWDSEVAVVKQSTAVMLAIFFCFFAVGLPVILLLVLPEGMGLWVEFGALGVLLAASVLLYRHAIRFDLREIDA